MAEIKQLEQRQRTFEQQIDHIEGLMERNLELSKRNLEQWNELNNQLERNNDRFAYMEKQVDQIQDTLDGLNQSLRGDK